MDFSIIVYGTGSLAKKISILFDKYNIPTSLYIDDYRTTPFEGKPVIHSDNYDASKGGMIFIGIGHPEHAKRARLTLLNSGANSKQIKHFSYSNQSAIDSVLSMLDYMLGRDIEKAVKSLVQSQCLCQSWEDIFFKIPKIVVRPLASDCLVVKMVLCLISPVFHKNYRKHIPVTSLVTIHIQNLQPTFCLEQQ
ncbi:MAG: hypothetical protein ABJH06_19040 [Paraglaciecola sp.]|uniref:hypothetical protein n=1 Tax=Paraglaciecola sp. TaxID=1920173 RepID=UPI003298AAED